MEGGDCFNIVKKTDKLAEYEMQDSGCEQSPTTPSPLQKCQELLESQPLVEKKQTYGREFLLYLQFSPLSLNPDADQLLWPEYDNSPPNGIFNPSHCYHSKPDEQSKNGRKEMLPEYFKPMLDNTSEILRPQRKSFVSGCQMRTSISESTNEKSSTPIKPSSSSQRRLSESKDRPRSVPTVERADRRVGSGRIVLERAESRPDSRGQPRPDSRGATRDKPAKPLVHADKRDNWRHRNDYDDDYPTTNHTNHKDGGRENARITRDNRDHRSFQNNGYNNRRHQQEPEWFTEDVTTSDTIELRGFDGHKEKIEKRERNEKEKKKASKQAVEKKELRRNGVFSETADGSMDLQIDSEKVFSPRTAEGDAGNDENLFDFDSFMDSMNLPHLNDSGETAADLSSSKFSRLFSKEDRNNPIHLSFGSAFGSSIGLPDELHVEAHMSSLVKELLSPSGLGDVMDSPRHTSPPARHPSTDGDRLLHMLQSSAAAASSTKIDKRKEKNELPAVLSQLLIPDANGIGDVRGKPELPSKYKTLEELEADLTPRKPVNPNQHREPDRAPVQSDRAPILSGRVPVHSDVTPTYSSHNKQKPPAEHSLPRKPEQEMTAFNMLVGLLKNTGELDKTVPKMPEVTNTETPNQQKKLLAETSLTRMEIAAQVENGSPILPHARPRLPQNSGPDVLSQNSIPAHQPNSHLVNARNTPPAIQPTLSSLPNMPAVIPNVGFFPAMASNSDPQGLGNIPPLMQASAPPVNLPTAVQPSAFHGPVNPLLQQTIHQRQKLPSPIMFGAQPPIHIVAPAAIHPMGQFQHILGQQQQHSGGGGPLMGQQNVHSGPVHSQHGQQVFDHFVSSASLAAPKPQPVTQTVSSMAFTPTSVIRKLANDKVDERHRQGTSDSQVKQLFDSLQAAAGGQQQMASMRAAHRQQQLVQQQQAQQQQQQAQQQQAQQQQQQAQQQQQQAQLMSMRPIVKNSGSSVAEQMITRHLMEQSQRQQQQHQHQQHQHHPANMFAQQQHQLPPPQNYHAFPQTNNINNLFPQHQPNNLLPQQQQQSFNLQHQNHSLGSLPPPNSQNHSLGSLPPPNSQNHSYNATSLGMSGPSVSPLHSLQQQLMLIQQKQQMRVGAGGGVVLGGKSSPDNITKWFCGTEIVNQQTLPLPKHAMLKLEDIEH